MATDLDLERMYELNEHPERLRTQEIGPLCRAIAKQLLQEDDQTLRASIAEQNERLAKSAGNYADAARALTARNRDLAHSDNYVQSLIRRLQDAVAGERTIREFQSHFVEQVQNCIDRKPISPECSAHPALLRLQEALDAEMAKPPPIK